MGTFILLTNEQYESLQKVSPDGCFSCYGLRYGDGWIIAADIMGCDSYSWVDTSILSYPIIEIDTAEFAE